MRREWGQDAGVDMSRSRERIVGSRGERDKHGQEGQERRGVRRAGSWHIIIATGVRGTCIVMMGSDVEVCKE